MDWIGDKLSMLIEQGKRALNSEIVIMSDAKEDEVDDGTGQWEEEEEGTSSSRTAASVKRKMRLQSVAAPSPPSYLPSSSSSRLTPSASFVEDESVWESPEMRASMVRARARLLGGRGT